MDVQRRSVLLLLLVASLVLGPAAGRAAPDRLFQQQPDQDRIVFPNRNDEPKSLEATPTNYSIGFDDYTDSEDEKKITYNGAQVWNVDIDGAEKLRVASGLVRQRDVASWGGSHSAVDFMIKPEKLTRVTKILNDNNIGYRIVIDDLQKYIDEENPPVEIDEETQDRKAKDYKFWHTYRTKGHIAMPVIKPASRRMAVLGAYMGYNSLDEHMEFWPTANWGHRMTWKQYHRLADIHDYLDFLATTYPEFCSVRTIGKSVLGEDLKVLRISTGGTNKKAVWIDGGIHAREWISPATVTYIINHFVENFENESDAIRNMEWYFLPVVNPDGYEFTHKFDRLWRKNRKRYGTCNGVDLNRNFDYQWGGQGTSDNKCSEIYRGEKPFSEPESKAMADFITNSAANFKMYISYHSYGQYILYPWGYDRVHTSDHSDLDRAGQEAAKAIMKEGNGTSYKVGVSSVVLYPASGGSDDWAKGRANIKYSYTIELSDKGQYGFILPASYIVRVAKESLAALRVLAQHAYAA